MKDQTKNATLSSFNHFLLNVSVNEVAIFSKK